MLPLDTQICDVMKELRAHREILHFCEKSGDPNGVSYWLPLVVELENTLASLLSQKVD